MTPSPDSSRPHPPRISVVVPTYNGESYIQEQLLSILTQNRYPDEVIILDDASRDSTPEIIRDWSASAPFPVEIVHRAENTGLNANITDGIYRASGDVIVLADQDDVWETQKLACVERAFFNARTSVWFSNAKLVDSRGTNLGVTAWEAVRFGEPERQAVQSGTSQGLLRLIRGMTVTGATMAFTKETAAFALPLPDGIVGGGGWLLHDGWIALMGFFCGEVKAEPIPLVRYRQHGAQATALAMLNANPTRAKASSQEMELEAERTSMIARIVRERSLPNSPQVDALLELNDYRIRRQKILNGSHAFKQVGLNIRTGAYAKFGRGRRTAVKDLARALSSVRRGVKTPRG